MKNRFRPAVALGALAACLCLTACESTSGRGDRIAQAVKDSKVEPMIGAPYNDVFRAEATGARGGDWPRAAITILVASTDVHKSIDGTRSAGLDRLDCVVFNLRLWSSDTESRLFERQRLCYGELSERMRAVRTGGLLAWGGRIGGAPAGNAPPAGAARGDGPAIPTTPFPPDAELAAEWLKGDRYTAVFVAGALQVLGYDWNRPGDRRVWFVTAPERPGFKVNGTRVK